MAALAGVASVSSVQAASVVVPNFSFEEDIAPPGGVMKFVPSGWLSFNQKGGEDIGSQNALAANYPVNNPMEWPAEGNQFAYVNMFANNAEGGGIFTDVGSLMPNTQYTLTVAIGSRADRLNSPGIISLVNGFDNTGTLLATGGGLPETQGTWMDYSITFTTGAEVSDNLIIVLSVLGAETIQADFDNVRLEATAVPEPSTIALCLLGGLGAARMIRRRRN